MTAGKAHGIDREYQARCRDVLIFRTPGLMPFVGDGIDIAFEMGGTTYTIDVVLQAPDGSLVVAECRRIVDSVEQGDVAEFAYKVELLRKLKGVRLQERS